MPLESPVYTGPVLTTQAGTLKRNDNTWSSGQTTAGEMWQPPSVDQREYQNSLLNFDRPRHLPHDGHAPSRPPPLGYVIRDKKLRILLFWCFILVDCALVPTGLYFVLWYEAGPGHQPPGSLDANTVLSIVTATIGGTSVMEWAMRCWRLWKKDSDCRVRVSLQRHHKT